MKSWFIGILDWECYIQQCPEDDNNKMWSHRRLTNFHMLTIPNCAPIHLIPHKITFQKLCAQIRSWQLAIASPWMPFPPHKIDCWVWPEHTHSLAVFPKIRSTFGPLVGRLYSCFGLLVAFLVYVALLSSRYTI